METKPCAHARVAQVPYVERMASPGRQSRLRLRSVPSRERGRITLVGAGLGGADLITVRGARALSHADVVLYDRLADPELLELAPRSAELICVGKGKGFGLGQARIGELLVERALSGMNVVRLKGGDPLVFGRGTEEIDAATDAGLEVEIVPGVSSSLGAPALAGIPLTERGVAGGFTVVSGHRASDEYDWAAVYQSGLTLVVLMAASTAQYVARDLLDVGASGEVPVAFIHAAGTSEQRSVSSRLADVAWDGCPLPSPTVMVVGEVARRHAGHRTAEISATA
jgi:uroporphyrin-III C-methyltransferase